MFARWGYRNQVRRTLEQIFSRVAGGAGAMKPIIQITFGNRLDAAIDSTYSAEANPNEAAATLAVMCIRRIVHATPDDAKALALHAISTGNTADHFANNLIAIIEEIARVGGETLRKSAIYETIGALEGRDGEELDNYRAGRMLGDILDDVQARHAAEE